MFEFCFHLAGVADVQGTVSEAFDNACFGSGVLTPSEIKVVVRVGWLPVHRRYKPVQSYVGGSCTQSRMASRAVAS